MTRPRGPVICSRGRMTCPRRRVTRSREQVIRPRECVIRPRERMICSIEHMTRSREPLNRSRRRPTFPHGRTSRSRERVIRFDETHKRVVRTCPCHPASCPRHAPARVGRVGTAHRFRKGGRCPPYKTFGWCSTLSNLRLSGQSTSAVRHNQPMLWTAPRRVESSSLVLCPVARRVARQRLSSVIRLWFS